MRYGFSRRIFDPIQTTLFSFIIICVLTALPSSLSAVQEQNSNNSSANSKRIADQATVGDPIENSVVRVFATLRAPDLTRPWSKQPGREVTGSGVVIEGKRILTNAHVVLYAGQVQIQGSQSGDTISARVEAIAPGIDLAVLKLNDESFFNSHKPLSRAEVLPAVKDSVMVYGFPAGGSTLSITQGIVSRIDFVSYNYPVSGLRVQIDAAINPGNSGGPAIVGDKMVGIAFSVLTNTQNIGYIIPCEEIELFLKDIADGYYDGKPAIFDEFQTLENPALRKFLKIKDSQGVVVRQPSRNDSAYPLKKWDVVEKIGDVSVDDQGKVMIGENRVPFTYLVQKLASNGKVPLTVVRSGQVISIQLPVTPLRPKLIPFLQGNYPSYFICGPMVFSVAVEELIAAISSGANGAMMTNALSLSGSPLYTRRGDRPAFEGEELVIVPSPFFSHPLVKNYSSPMLRIVKNVNGTDIKNLRHLVEIIRDTKTEFITIEFAGQSAETLVFPSNELISATDEILNDAGIRSQGSADMMAVWNQKSR